MENYRLLQHFNPTDIDYKFVKIGVGDLTSIIIYSKHISYQQMVEDLGVTSCIICMGFASFMTRAKDRTKILSKVEITEYYVKLTTNKNEVTNNLYLEMIRLWAK